MPNQTLMEPTNPKTRHKPEKTKVGEEVLDLVIPYIHNVDDRNSVSLVSRNFYEIEGITRKCLTVHVHYYPNPASLSKRFPFIESLTLKGPMSDFNETHYTRYPDIRITPWIEQLALEFRCLKELHIARLIVNDEDLEKLASTRGKDLRSLKIKKCQGFSTDGLMHVSKYCNQLRTLCWKSCWVIELKDAIWLHQLALSNMVLERFHVTNLYTTIYNAEDLTLLAKNCSNSLISLKIGECHLSKLRDAFGNALMLEHFGGYSCDQESDLVGFQFPPNIHSFSRLNLHVTQYLGILPLLNQIRKLKLAYIGMRVECQCLLFKRCPNLEVLYTLDECRDNGLQVISRFCKKLRKLTYKKPVTHVGLIPLAKRCTKLECLKVRLNGISNEAIKCLGNLKNLRKLRMNLILNDGNIDLPLDNGILAMLMGCRKLERLKIVNYVRLGGILTDVGLEYIGSYGANLRSLSLDHIGKYNAGLVKLSEGCPRLRNLKLKGCPISKEAVSSCVFNLPSLRYVSGYSDDFTPLALTRPEF